jgi:hypothetical protein
VCTAAVLQPVTLSPFDERFINGWAVTGVTDPDGDPISVAMTRVTQDERSGARRVVTLRVSGRPSPIFGPHDGPAVAGSIASRSRRPTDEAGSAPGR